MNEKKCFTCYFVYILDGQRAMCRRYPPPSLEIDYAQHTKWPTVGDDDWCGEWKEYSIVEEQDGNQD